MSRVKKLVLAAQIIYVIGAFESKTLGLCLANHRTGPALEAFHDVSGTVEAEFPETATRVIVRVRVNDAFVQTGSDDRAIGLDTRFDVLVHQALPFSLLEGSQWAAMIAVRSLFFDPRHTASMFDELLVVRPPKQVVGGLVVHF